MHDSYMKTILPFLPVLLVFAACAPKSPDATATAGAPDAATASSVASAPAPEAVAWMTDATAAMAKAKAENKVMLMDFTGSDWCIWCQRLDEEVFSTDTFKTYAAQNLVLLKLDFPRRSEQSEAEKQQNRALAEKYGIQGFPTVLVFNAAGEKIGQTGYVRGGPDAWLASLKEITGS
jgi:protein disulfide-isomerase